MSHCTARYDASPGDQTHSCARTAHPAGTPHLCPVCQAQWLPEQGLLRRRGNNPYTTKENR